MTTIDGSMNVAGERVICEAWSGRARECEPDAIHRLDRDLELCVCKRCGQGWIREVNAWTKVMEAAERLSASMQTLDAVAMTMLQSLQTLADVLKKTNGR